MRKSGCLLVRLGVVVVLLAVFFPTAVLAHEQRLVGGKYKFVVGFLSEPAIVGELNGVELHVTVPGDSDKPVEGLQDTLEATLIVGGGARSMPIKLQARFGQPGAYAGYFIPTREGSYIFQFKGEIDGVRVDERFESGPGRFNDVVGVEPLQFPDKEPDVSAMADVAKAAQAEAGLARTIGIAGVFLGLAGLVVGGVSLATIRRRDRANRSQRIAK
ncbi:MAG: hypothetical protein HYY30_05820 [Chloroflexi bacterium]|nr:hypothetical protein [Chloroflexota bacterium]